MRIKQISLNEWYDIPGYGGKYQINYFGNIRRALKRGYKDLHPYIKSSNGRRIVKLNGKEQVVMKLMQITFIGALPPGKVAYHKNGIITDDALKAKQFFLYKDIYFARDKEIEIPKDLQKRIVEVIEQWVDEKEQELKNI